MSFDLLVFEPDMAPRNRDDFLVWYHEQTAWSNDHPYGDLSQTTVRLSVWYHEIVRTFPDIRSVGDGLVDKNIDENFMAEYVIGRSTIYVSFRWPVSEDAYQLLRSFAVMHGVGFFDVSADHGAIWFPPADRKIDKTPVPDLLLTLEAQQPFEAPSLALIHAAVDWLDPAKGPGFLILENRAGDYAQVGGGKDACLLEWREWSGPRFRHWIAGMHDFDPDPEVLISGHGTEYVVAANQRLSDECVKSILVAFALREPRPDQLLWQDITWRFDEDESSTEDASR